MAKARVVKAEESRGRESRRLLLDLPDGGSPGS